MGDVIRLCDKQPADPILRKGDLVRLVNMEEFADIEAADNEELHELYCSAEGCTGIVVCIDMILPPSHPEAPGQATYITVAVPCEEDEDEEDGWHEIDSISIFHVRRIISEETNEFKGYASL